MNNDSLCKADINDFYNATVFDSTVNWAVQYNVTEEINENISIIQSRKQDYNNEFKIFLDQVQPIADQKFAICETIRGKLNVIKWICIVSCIAFFFMVLFFGAYGAKSVLGLIFKMLLLAVTLLILLINGVRALIFRSKFNKSKEQYDSYISELQYSARQLIGKYEKEVNALRNKIDSLYLNSLSPAHREMVLMRRDQERQHQERMRIEEERLRSQKRIEEEQRMARAAQEKLLQIEQDREDRIQRARKQW